MNIPGVRFISALLVISLMAACSPTKSILHPPDEDDFEESYHYIIEGNLYQKLAAQGDTLYCQVMRVDQDGERVRVSTERAKAAGFKLELAATLQLRTAAASFGTGDTLAIPYAQVANIHRTVSNPAHPVGVAVGLLTVVGIVIGIFVVAAIISFMKSPLN
ncbi:hypothetical protein KQI65_07020 [bacterium]|nr:hypothetical protein [bacterium]